VAVKVDVITIFPKMVEAGLAEGVVGRARSAGLLDIVVHNLRDYTTDKHHVVDDVPFGGGPGMVMKPEPVFAAVEALGGLYGGAAVLVLILLVLAVRGCLSARRCELGLRALHVEALHRIARKDQVPIVYWIEAAAIDGEDAAHDVTTSLAPLYNRTVSPARTSRFAYRPPC
jgi:hypothetical protein